MKYISSSSGKTTFLKTLKSLFEGRVIKGISFSGPASQVSELSHSTLANKTYAPGFLTDHVVIMDVVGKNEKTYKEDTLECMLNGALEPDFGMDEKVTKSAKVQEFKKKRGEDDTYINLNEAFHVVVLVYDQANISDEVVKVAMKTSYTTFISLGYQPLIVVTHLDHADPRIMLDPAGDFDDVKTVEENVKLSLGSTSKRGVLYHNSSEVSFSIDKNTYKIFEEILNTAKEFLEARTKSITRESKSSIKTSSNTPVSTTNPTSSNPSVSPTAAMTPSSAEVTIVWKEGGKSKTKILSNKIVFKDLLEEFTTRWQCKGDYCLANERGVEYCKDDFILTVLQGNTIYLQKDD